jgi:signal peptidase I
MAPALLGEHRRATCRDCGFAFACGEDSLPAGMRAVCPNCGAPCDLQALPVLSGDRLIIDRADYALSGPQRWDVVVLRTPDDPLTLCVKRIVGLPGETVEIRGGDVYVDGQLARKSLRRLLALAIVVHDARCRPVARAGSRWKPDVRTAKSNVEGDPDRRQTAPTTGSRRSESPPTPAARSTSGTTAEKPGVGSGWRQIASGFECSAGPDIEWLAYEHQQTHAGGPIAGRIGPILDDLAYNQDEPRELVPVPDVILRCRVAIHGSGQLWLRADDGRKRFEIDLDADTGRGELWSGGQRLERFSAGRGALDRPTEVMLALVDAQLRFSLGGRQLVDYAYDPAGYECQPSARPLAIGAQAASLSVSDVQVLRDVYYLSSGAGGSAAPRRLGGDEYWLLGDNSAVSIDSRSWPAARANLFIGKVLIHRPASGQ